MSWFSKDKPKEYSNPPGFMYYSELLKLYSPNESWIELYEAYLDNKMEPAHARQFGFDYLTPQHLLAVAIIRLTKCIQAKS